jgi:hypothetical protein
MKQRTTLMAAGGLGGAIGSLAAELVPFDEDLGIGVVLTVAAWSAVLSGPIALALRWGIALNGRHRWPSVAQAAGAVSAGVVAGGIGGAISQNIFNYFSDGWFKDVVARDLCWGIMGAGLGLCLAFAIPNLRKWTGAAWGGAGGLVGGAVFVGMSFLELPEAISRLAGVAIIGALVAAGIAIAESVEARRSATLEVTFGPKEVVRLMLGPTPVTFGGSARDTVYVRGFDHAALTVTMRNGAVVARQAGGKEVALRDGSSLQIGAVSMKVRSA